MASKTFDFPAPFSPAIQVNGPKSTSRSRRFLKPSTSKRVSTRCSLGRNGMGGLPSALVARRGGRPPLERCGSWVAVSPIHKLRAVPFGVQPLGQQLGVGPPLDHLAAVDSKGGAADPGHPYRGSVSSVVAPPGSGAASRTVTDQPASARTLAATSPLGPAPMTTASSMAVDHRLPAAAPMRPDTRTPSLFPPGGVTVGHPGRVGWSEGGVPCWSAPPDHRVGLAVLVGELGAVQLGVQAPLGQQLGVGAPLDHPAAVNDQQLVGLPDGGQPVGDDQ